MPNQLEIEQQIIEKTECDKGFACLSGTSIYCSVLATLGHSLVKLECCQHLDCLHNKAYGSLRACSCPVRHEIFTKYGR